MSHCTMNLTKKKTLVFNNQTSISTSCYLSKSILNLRRRNRTKPSASHYYLWILALANVGNLGSDVFTFTITIRPNHDLLSHLRLPLQISFYFDKFLMTAASVSMSDISANQAKSVQSMLILYFGRRLFCFQLK